MKFIRTIFPFLIVFLLSTASIGANRFFEAGVERLKVPVEAPDFRLKALGGGIVSLREFRGKIVLLGFFSPWCPNCRKEASSFNRLDGKINHEQVVLLIVAFEGKEKDWGKFKKELNLSVPILIGKDRSVTKAYGVSWHPEFFFINRDGRIVGKAIGESRWTSEEMMALIQYLLSEGK